MDSNINVVTIFRASGTSLCSFDDWCEKQLVSRVIAFLGVLWVIFVLVCEFFARKNSGDKYTKQVPPEGRSKFLLKGVPSLVCV